MSQGTSDVVSGQSLYLLCQRLEGIPTEICEDDEEEGRAIWSRKLALESLSCADKVEYARAALRMEMEMDKQMDSGNCRASSMAMALQALNGHLIFDQMMRLSEIQNPVGSSLFLALSKFHKSCMKFSHEEHGFMVQTNTAQQLKECQDHSERLRLLSHQRSEYFKKKKERL